MSSSSMPTSSQVGDSGEECGTLDTSPWVLIGVVPEVLLVEVLEDLEGGAELGRDDLE